MVTFNCDDCGNTLRKKAIANHHCPRRTFVCIDCQVSMPFAQAQKHTECITEGEKYMGSDYKGPRKREFNDHNDKNDNKRQKTAPVKISLSHLGVTDSDDEPKPVAKPVAVPAKTKPAFLQKTSSSSSSSSSDDEQKSDKQTKTATTESDVTKESKSDKKTKAEPVVTKESKSDKKNKQLEKTDKELTSKINDDVKSTLSNEEIIKTTEKILKKKSFDDFSDLYNAVAKKLPAITPELFGAALVCGGKQFQLIKKK